MSNTMQAIELLEKENAPTKGWAYLSLAQIYKDMSADNTKNYIDKSIGYSKQALLIYTYLKDTSGMANSLSMIGILDRDNARLLGNNSYYDSAYTAFYKAIKLTKLKGGKSKNIAKFYNNMSQVFSRIQKGL